MSKSFQSVDLVIQGAGHRIVLEMQDGFQTGYENEIEAKVSTMITHPMTYMWKGGKVKPFTVELDLHVGVQRNIDTPNQLRDGVQALRDMCLPVNRTATFESVLVCVKGTRFTWFSCRAFLESMQTTWMPPYDVLTGIPHHAKVSLSFTPTYSQYAGSESNTDMRSLPKRPWRFAAQVGGK